MTLQEIATKYRELCHAMQSGVAAWMNYDPSETSPKHLRVGVNSALADCSALAKLLMAKGIITEEEYYTAIMEGMQGEVKSYEQKINEHLGAKGRIKLM
jgi:hypothetical protein